MPTPRPNPKSRPELEPKPKPEPEPLEAPAPSWGKASVSRNRLRSFPISARCLDLAASRDLLIARRLALDISRSAICFWKGWRGGRGKGKGKKGGEVGKRRGRGSEE